MQSKLNKGIIALTVLGVAVAGTIFYQGSTISTLREINNNYQKKTDTAFWYLFNTADATPELARALEKLSNIDSINDKAEAQALFDQAEQSFEAWRVEQMQLVHLKDYSSDTPKEKYNFQADILYGPHLLSMSRQEQRDFQVTIFTNQLGNVIRAAKHYYTSIEPGKLPRETIEFINQTSSKLFELENQMVQLRARFDIVRKMGPYSLEKGDELKIQIFALLESSIGEIGIESQTHVHDLTEVITKTR